MIAVNPPNVISIVRILLVVPIIMLLLARAYYPTLMLFVVAGVSDALDGFLARRFGWRTRLGSVLDPLADKALLVTVFITLAWLQLMPAWLLWLILGREVIIIVGGLLYHYMVGAFDIRPTMLSKLNTVLQITFGVAVVFHAASNMLGPTAVSILLIATGLTTLFSGLDYIRIFGRQAVRHFRGSSAP